MNALRTGLVRIALSLVLTGCILLPITDAVHAQGGDVIVTISDLDVSTFPTIQVGVSVRNRKGVPIRLKRPRVDLSQCIGCAICENRCPVRDKRAIYVTPYRESRSLQIGRFQT